MQRSNRLRDIKRGIAGGGSLRVRDALRETYADAWVDWLHHKCGGQRTIEAITPDFLAELEIRQHDQMGELRREFADMLEQMAKKLRTR